MLGLSCSIMVGAKFGLGAPDSGKPSLYSVFRLEDSHFI